MCLRHGPVTERLQGRSPSARVSAVVCWCFADSGVERRDVDEQNQNGSAKVPKATNIEPKGCQNKQKMFQSRALERSEFKLVYVEFLFIGNCINCHGTLAGLTFVKGRSVKIFYLGAISWKMWFLTLLGLTTEKDRSVRSKLRTNEERVGTIPRSHF